MVLGIGEGSVELELDKTVFSPGETVKGKARLKLNSPKEARGLRLEFYGEQQKTEMAYSGGRGRSRTRTVRVYEQKAQLGEKRAYQPGEEFPFEMRVPQEVASFIPQKQEGLLGAVAGLFQKKTSWFVAVSLDLPMAFDISNKVRVELKRQA